MVSIVVVSPGTSHESVNGCAPETASDASRAHHAAVYGNKELHDWVMLDLSRRIDQSASTTWYCRRCRRVEQIVAPAPDVVAMG